MSVLPANEANVIASSDDRGAAQGARPARVAEPEGAAAALRDAELEALVRRMLELLGEDTEREGLRDTPARVRKSLQWLTRGYAERPEAAIGEAIFEERHESIVLVRGIDFHSLCEHHMLPFFGQVHVGYIPDGRVVGLSKLARLIDVYARRLQVQERLTENVAGALDGILRPRAVGVIVEAQHHCMMMRGVEKQGSTTLTSAWRGAFAEEPAGRTELLGLLAIPSSRVQRSSGVVRGSAGHA